MTARADEVRRAADFEQIVREVTELRPVGKRWVARCPFHEGADPTLAVDAEDKRYVCVECNASGDVFRFVQEVHGLDHDAAVEWIAARSAAG